MKPIFALAFTVVMMLTPVLDAQLAGVARAAGHDYTVAGNDGYGIDDCLATGSECGHVVAEAWCETHGHGHVISFGSQASVDVLTTKISTADDTYVVRCND